MLSPRLQELEIHIMNETRCSEIMLETYDPVTRLCYENTDSGSCMVCRLVYNFSHFSLKIC